jgi:endoglucanase
VPNYNVHIAEVCIWPGGICVIVNDQDIEQGAIVELATAEPANLGVLRQSDPVTGAASGSSGQWAVVMGKKNGSDGKYVRFGDTQPTNYADRVEIADVSNWSVGAIAVDAVRLKIKPRREGLCYPSGGFTRATTSQLHCFLELDTMPVHGQTYTIACTGAGFTSFDWTYDETATRLIGLNATQLGYRPADGGKLARFQLWVPGYGTEGRVSLAATEFEVVDEYGGVIATLPIEFYLDAVTNDADCLALAGGNDGCVYWDDGLLRYASSTIPPKLITAVTMGATTSFTCAGHGFETGQYKYIHGIGQSDGFGSHNLIGALNGIFQITVTGTDTFTIAVNSAGFNAYASGAFEAGFDSLVYDTFQANAYNTPTYHLDFTSVDFSTIPGSYHLRVPGLGISDTFEIGDHIRRVDAANSAKGYYNQSTGVELDAAYGGIDRIPAAQVDGVNGYIAYETLLPGDFVAEAGISSPTYCVGNSDVAKSPFLTADRVTGFGIGIRDAGDTDYFPNAHCQMPYFILEFAFRHLPLASRSIDTGFPKASTLIGSEYAYLDDEPDQIHMAVLQLHDWKAHQLPDGRVYGGVQFNGDTFASGGAHGGSQIEPSNLSTQQMVVLQASPAGNYHYAMAAAKLSQVLDELGHTTAAADWLASAELAWDWAETLYQDWVANGSSQTLIDAYLDTDLGVKSLIKTAKGWDETAWDANIERIYEGEPGTNAVSMTRQLRWAAAGTLYNVTDNKTPYGNIIGNGDGGNQGPKGNLAFGGAQGDWSGVGMWEFCQAPSAVDYTTPQPQVAYYNSNWLQANPHKLPELNLWMAVSYELMTDTLDGDSPYLQALRDMVNRDSGAWQLGISRTNGIGVRGVLNTVNRDRQALGYVDGEMLGVSHYINFSKASQFGGLNIFNFSTDSPLNFTVEYPTGDYTGLKQIIKPFRAHYPLAECFWDNSYCIYDTEYTTQQNITPRYQAAVILHAWDGNTAEDAGVKRIRRQVQVAA